MFDALSHCATNDITEGVDKIGNYTQIVNYIKTTRPTIKIAIIPNREKRQKEHRKKVSELNRELKVFCEDNLTYLK